MSKLKVDLSSLKRLVSELELQLGHADSLVEIELSKEKLNDYIVEMSKATGLASGIIKESTMLIDDIDNLIAINAQSTNSANLKSMLGHAPKSGSGYHN
jgi:hypothetical protein